MEGVLYYGTKGVLLFDAMKPQGCELAFFKRFKILDSLSPKSGRLLSWTHYRHLLQVESDEALRWYLDEAAAEAWSVRTL